MTAGSDTRPPSPGRWSRVRNLVRATVTVPVFLAHHLVRRRAVTESTKTVDQTSEAAPTGRSHGDVQPMADGVGPVVMRSYEVEIAGAQLAPVDLLRCLIAAPDELNDRRIAGFVRDDQPAADLEPGDELVVEIPGPWHGPVRVERADDEMLLLQTLEGHMEAGLIRFDVTPSESDRFVFRIRSWARGGDVTFTLLHLGLGLAKVLQTAMWVAMLHGAVRVAGGERHGPMRVSTEVVADSTSADDPFRSVKIAHTDAAEVVERAGGG